MTEANDIALARKDLSWLNVIISTIFANLITIIVMIIIIFVIRKCHRYILLITPKRVDEHKRKGLLTKVTDIKKGTSIKKKLLT